MNLLRSNEYENVRGQRKWEKTCDSNSDSTDILSEEDDMFYRERPPKRKIVKLNKKKNTVRKFNHSTRDLSKANASRSREKSKSGKTIGNEYVDGKPHEERRKETSKHTKHSATKLWKQRRRQHTHNEDYTDTNKVGDNIYNAKQQVRPIANFDCDE